MELAGANALVTHATAFTKDFLMLFVETIMLIDMRNPSSAQLLDVHVSITALAPRKI